MFLLVYAAEQAFIVLGHVLIVIDDRESNLICQSAPAQIVKWIVESKLAWNPKTNPM